MPFWMIVKRYAINNIEIYIFYTHKYNLLVFFYKKYEKMEKPGNFEIVCYLYS